MKYGSAVTAYKMTVINTWMIRTTAVSLTISQMRHIQIMPQQSSDGMTITQKKILNISLNMMGHGLKKHDGNQKLWWISYETYMDEIAAYDCFLLGTL